MTTTIQPDAIHLVCFSGGKDSVAMVLHLLELGIPPSKIILHHHEKDGKGQPLFDWATTTQYCEAFAAAFGLTLLFSYREGGILREMHRNNEGLQDVLYQRVQGGPYHRLKSKKGNSSRGMWPAVSADLRVRWCSMYMKIHVLDRVIANHPDYQDGNFVVCTGERWEESPKRSKYKEFQPHNTDTKTGRKVVQWRPVLKWDHRAVWSILERWQVQPHPCYELGWSRCSCQCCIFSSANTWADIARINPEKIDRIDQEEQELGHQLYHGMSIRQKVDLGQSTLDPNDPMVAQATQAFTLPIIKEHWTLPKGAHSKERTGAL